MENAFVIIIIYVDDVLLGATDNYLLDTVVKQIVNQFDISSEGPVNTFLNITKTRQEQPPTVQLYMESYMEQVFERFNMIPNSSIQTPLNDDLDVVQAEVETGRSSIRTVTQNFRYRENLDRYYMIIKRPDLMFAVNMLSRFSHRPTARAAARLTRALHYAYNIKRLKLTLGGNSTMITGYANANLAACRLSKLSLSSYVVFIGYGPVE